MKGETRKRVLSVIISLVIIFGILISGPASAVTLYIHSPSDTTPTQGDLVSFIIEVDLADGERLPIQNLSLVLTRNGDTPITCDFALNGSMLSGGNCEDLTILPLGSRPVGYGYGYMFGYGYGYFGTQVTTTNTTFGYGYGYGYTQGYGYGGQYTYSELAYNVTWNTQGWQDGSWYINLYANVLGPQGQYFQFRTQNPLVIFLNPGVVFSFAGYTYDTAKNPLNGTNVTIEMVTGFGPGAQLSWYSALSNENGFFNITNIPYNNMYLYKPIVIKYNGSDAQYVGQSLPHFPGFEFSNLGLVSFFLKEAVTINLTAYNQTGGAVAFRYMVKDAKLGYPVDQNFASTQTQALVHLPADRNYSIMIYPDNSMPITYNLNNISLYDPKHIDIAFNTTMVFKWVSGYATLSDGSAGFDNFGIIPFLVEIENMVSFNHPMPYNMSAWRWPPASDQKNKTTGFYNITLPGAAMGGRILLFATGNKTDGWYGGFKIIELNASSPDVTDLNITMYKLIGDNRTTIDLEGPTGTVKIQTLKKRFVLQNATGSRPNSAHIEFNVNYPEANFTWMLDTSSGDNGTFSVPVLNKTIKKIAVYSPDFAPLKTKLSLSKLASDPVNITLTRFRPGGVEGEDFTQYLKLALLTSKPECDIPNPPQACMIANTEMNMSDFNPLSVIMGGGDISFRMRLVSNNITVHYKKVDMLASGPPDALFDSAANESQSGSSIEAAWRFGSRGPEIYDAVLIGIPYNESKYDESGNFAIKIEKFYDESWNVIWQLGVNTTLPSEYGDYNTSTYQAYLTESGMICSKSNHAATCFVNTTSNMVWFWVPHFSGIAPVLSGQLSGVTTTTTTTSVSGGAGVGTTTTVQTTTTIPTFTIESANAGETKRVDLSTSDVDIQYIDVTFANSVSGVGITIEKFDTPPEGAPVISVVAGGKVYSYLSITTTASSDDISSVTISFKVPKSWFIINGLDPQTTTLARYDGAWTNLPTVKISEDNEFYYFEAVSPGFSVFAIFAQPVVTPTTTVPATTVTPTTVVTTVPTTVIQPEGKPDFTGYIVGIIVILLILGAVLYYKKFYKKFR